MWKVSNDILRTTYLVGLVIAATTACRGTVRCPDGERFDDSGECAPVSTCPAGRDPITGICRGDADGGPPSDANLPDGCTVTRYYLDEDMDGVGGDTAIDSCEATPPSGYAAETNDCDDADNTIHPGADESCNGVDDDCDGTLDEGLMPRSTYYLDSDEDGSGDSSTSTEACAAPDGYVEAAGDCAPADSTVYPGADEICNSADDDCDDVIDEGLMAPVGSPVVLASVDGFTTPALTPATTGYWAAFIDDTDDHVYVSRLTLEGAVIDTFPAAATPATREYGLDIARVQATGEERFVVGWQGDGAFRTRVFDSTGAALADESAIGAGGGDQRGISLVSAGERVLAGWFGGQNLEARFVDSTTGGPVGEVMSVSVSDSTVTYFGIGGAVAVTAPELVVTSASPFRAVVGYAATPTVGMPQDGYLAVIDGSLDATWNMPTLTNVTPFHGTAWLFLAPSLPDGRIHVSVAGENSDGSYSGCTLSAEFGDTSSPATLSSCDPLGGIPAVATLHGTNLVAAETRTDRLGITEIATGDAASGASFTEVATSVGRPFDIEFASENEGMILYSRGSAAPYELVGQRLGCE
ncbi:MAG TPA: putative metal-binding motif-containing protein [Sandaracinaceae bacterium LLY-WYZ-13_1]|nr:putative metal-binding motif-containing protein [Sandaracinaceae bacterium LLY-WYZ-13_1]